MRCGRERAGDDEGVRTWAGPARPRRLSVVTRTRGRSHPRTGHTGVTVVVTGIHVNSDTYIRRGDG